MDVSLDQIVSSYFKYYPKNNIDQCYGFLFRVLDKTLLKNEKENTLNEITKIKEHPTLEVLSKELFQKRFLKLSNTGHELTPILKIKEKIRLRFAPNPNYKPTIGNLRGWILNKYLLDNALPGSQLFLRLDDTDPKNKPATDSAISGYLEMVNDYLPNTSVIRCSERLDFYYEKAREYLTKKLLFIEGYTETEPLKIFFQMIFDNSLYKKVYCITNLKKEYCFRVIPLEEQVVKNKNNYCLFPTLVFQTTIDDDFYNITHAARGKDLIEIGRRQSALGQVLNLRVPCFLHWGRIKILADNKIEKISSSAYAKKEKENLIDEVSYTYENLKNRGYSSKVLEAFILSYGFTENDITLDLNRLNYFKTKFEKTSP